MPAGVYRLLDSPRAPNRNPVLVTSQAVVQTSRQITEHLLCTSCEQILQREGEGWVLPLLATREGAFPLHDILTARPPDLVMDGATAYAGSSNPRLRVRDMTHFALGIFWKASVHSWKSGPRSAIPRLKLGSCEQGIRTFLFCDGPFPENIALAVSVMPVPVTTMVAVQPLKAREADGVFHFAFMFRELFLFLPLARMGPAMPRAVSTETRRIRS